MKKSLKSFHKTSYSTYTGSVESSPGKFELRVVAF